MEASLDIAAASSVAAVVKRVVILYCTALQYCGSCVTITIADDSSSRPVFAVVTLTATRRDRLAKLLDSSASLRPLPDLQP